MIPAGNSRTPKAQSHDSRRQDPASQVAEVFFGTLAIVALGGAVVGFPFWTQKALSTALFLLFAATAYAGLILTRRGRHAAAMHSFAVLAAVFSIALMAVSVHLTSPTLIVVTVMAAYAAVCGRAYALVLGAAYLLAAILLRLGPLQALAIPKLFPTHPAAEIVGAAIAMAGILWPLSLVFHRLRDSILTVDAENKLREAAENQARQSEAQIRSLGDNLPEGFVYQYQLLGGRHGFKYISDGVTHVLGLQPAALMADAKLLFDMIEAGSLRQYLVAEARSARELADYVGTLPFELPHGRRVWLQLRSRPHRQPDGSILWDGVALDVTERRRAEDELEAHRLHLEEMVRQRTLELADARERAEAANVAKSAFLANMSHEIRTPLNAVIGLAHLIREGGLSAEQAERLGKLEGAADHLLAIINAILDLSKIEAGKFTLEELPVGIEGLVANVRSMLVDRAEAAGLELVVESDAFPRNLVGDPTRLQQALLNYANNAIKFTRRGTVTIRARLVEDAAADALVRFEVQDTGVGIDPAMLRKLFAAFEQGDASTTRKSGGTGLGLAITRKLAELMRGEVGVQSQPGLGSTFWFTCRLRKAALAEHAAAPRPHEEDAASILRRDFAGTRILVAEDNEINQEVAKAILESVGFEVDLAEDGLVAVVKATRQDYALVLMDMQMPNLDGLDASREIRKTRSQAVLPIIAMTANAFAEDKVRCYAAGMDDFIGKPVEPNVLFAVLLNWLRRARIHT